VTTRTAPQRTPPFLTVPVPVRADADQREKMVALPSAGVALPCADVPLPCADVSWPCADVAPALC